MDCAMEKKALEYAAQLNQTLLVETNVVKRPTRMKKVVKK
jgi:hypothetical protein